MAVAPHVQKALNDPRPPGRALDALERDIAGVWSKVLGQPVEVIGATADLFDLGADDESLTAISLGLSGEVGVQVAPEDLAGASRLEDQAVLIKTTGRRQYGHGRPPDSIAPGVCDRAPVFCLGGLGVPNHVWARLGKMLDPTLPLYAMESAGFDERGRPHRRIPAIAEYHVRSIRTLVGDKPVVLVGYSFGGRVAYEIARQLHADGQDVAGLVLLDSPAKQRFNRAPWTRKLFKYNVRKTWRREKRALRRRVLLRARSLGLVRSTDEKARVRWLIAAQSRANRVYRPKRYGGRLTLLTAESFARDRFEHLGWEPYVTGGIDIVRLEGDDVDHMGIMRERGMSNMAPVLEEHLLRLTDLAATRAGERAAPAPAGWSRPRRSPTRSR